MGSTRILDKLDKMQLNNIPDWMEEFISNMTEGAMTTKAELEAYIGEDKSGMQGVMRNGAIVNLNNQIALLESLHADGVLVNKTNLTVHNERP